MIQAEAVAFLSRAVDRSHRVVADLGCGSGTFTLALDSILDPGATIYAVDRDPAALRKLSVTRPTPPRSRIIPILADLGQVDAIAELSSVQLDAAILGNVLHYFGEPDELLRSIAARLSAHGRIVLVEYDRSSSNQWVPYPIPVSSVPRLAERIGMRWHGVMAERPSRYQGRLYCGFLTLDSNAMRTPGGR